VCSRSASGLLEKHPGSRKMTTDNASAPIFIVSEMRRRREARNHSILARIGHGGGLENEYFKGHVNGFRESRIRVGDVDGPSGVVERRTAKTGLSAGWTRQPVLMGVQPWAQAGEGADCWACRSVPKAYSLALSLCRLRPRDRR
jgi:hypothetical protein